MNQHSLMMVTCCQPTKININYNCQYALWIWWRAPPTHCGDTRNPEGSPFNATWTLQISSFCGSGSFNQLLGNGLHPTGKQNPTWLVRFKASHHDGEELILSHLPPQHYLAWLWCPPHPALIPLLPLLLLEILIMTHIPCLLSLELWNLCECADNVTKLEVLATPRPQLYQQIAHLQALDCTIWHLEHLVQKEQKELHEVFSVLEVEEITKVLASSSFVKGWNNTSPIRFINATDHLLLQFPFLTLLWFAPLFLLNRQLLLWNPCSLRWNNCPLTIWHSLTKLISFDVRDVMRMGMFWKNVPMTIHGTQTPKPIHQFLMGKRQWFPTILVGPQSWSWRRLGSLQLREGVVLWFPHFLISSLCFLLQWNNTWSCCMAAFFSFFFCSYFYFFMAHHMFYMCTSFLFSFT